MKKEESFPVKPLLWGLVFLGASLLIIALTSFNGVVVYKNQDKQALEESRGRFFSAQEMEAQEVEAKRQFDRWIESQRNISAREQLAKFKRGSFYFTWMPWLLFGWFFHRWGVRYFFIAIAPLIASVAVGLLWPVELLLILFAILVSFVARKHVYERYFVKKQHE
jgi:Flp pilus assembly protein TadB